MVIDSDSKHVNQKKCRKLATIQVVFGVAMVHFRTSGYGKSEHVVEVTLRNRRQVLATVYDDPCKVLDCGDRAAAWFSEQLNMDVRLVEMPREGNRKAWYEDETESLIGFADRGSLLIISEASLEDLNARLTLVGKDRISMDRFRPNLVIAGCDPYEEETWRVIEVNGIRIHMTIPCHRCDITTNDQRTGEKMGDEPMRTLATYRRWKSTKKPYRIRPIFGMNANHQGTGVVTVGDKIKVLKRGEPFVKHELAIPA